MFTPNNITELKENDIFVFGSNKAGNHAVGAAKVAVEKFGAIVGQGEGLQGQSYAFPTLDEYMQKVTSEELVSAFENLCECAVQHKDKTFYLTKVGCGIDGFTEEEIIEAINKVELPNNVIIPESFNVIYSYKAFDRDMTCRGFVYKEGKSYEEKEAIACNRGFHACRNPFDVLDFYPLVDDNCNFSRFAEVVQSGNIDEKDNKTCSSKIKIKAEIGFPGFIHACIEWIKEKTSPDKVKATVPNSGDYAKIGSSGYSAKIQSTGNDSVIMCAGYNSIASAKKGSWITLAEWAKCKEKNAYVPVCVKTEYVDGDIIKEDTFYKLVNGKFTEV